MENRSNKSRGLGDDIKRITSATRIDKIAERIAEILGQESCGCNERQEELNKMFPRKTKR